MTHLHLQIVLANTQWARPGQMRPTWPKAAAARLSWRRATTTNYVGGENSGLKCKIMAMWLRWAHARRSNLSYSNRDKRLKSSRWTPLGSDRCLTVIGRHRRLATRKCRWFNQSKVRDSDRQLLQPMGEDHAARTLPAMADKALSVCVRVNKLDRIKSKADYNQFMHEI